MASGLIAGVALAASTNTTLYTVPASTLSLVTVRLCNRSTSAVTVRIALSSSDTPSDGQYIVDELLAPNGGIVHESAITLDAGKKVVVWASATGVNANGWKIEEAA